MGPCGDENREGGSLVMRGGGGSRVGARAAVQVLPITG